MGTNKNLRSEIRQLQDIVNLLLNNWKSKHPEDFIPSPNLVFYQGQGSGTTLNTSPIVPQRNKEPSEIGCDGDLSSPDTSTKKGCGKAFQAVFKINALYPDDYLICGFTRIGDDIQYCSDCRSSTKPSKEDLTKALTNVHNKIAEQNPDWQWDTSSTLSAPLREDVRLKLQEWITMLDTPEFNETDAELVRNEMEHCISKNSEIIGNRLECKENTESVINSDKLKGEQGRKE